jgi:hypothetical protein
VQREPYVLVGGHLPDVELVAQPTGEEPGVVVGDQDAPPYLCQRQLGQSRTAVGDVSSTCVDKLRHVNLD